MTTIQEWEDALAEWNSAARQPAVWARCLDEAGGDEDQARAAYIKERAGSADLTRRGPAADYQPVANSPYLKEKKTNWWVWGPIGAVLLFILWVTFRTQSPEQAEKSRARLNIELCWKEQEKKSLDPASQRFVAAACEGMEEAFRQRYRVNP